MPALARWGLLRVPATSLRALARIGEVSTEAVQKDPELFDLRAATMLNPRRSSFSTLVNCSSPERPGIPARHIPANSVKGEVIKVSEPKVDLRLLSISHKIGPTSTMLAVGVMQGVPLQGSLRADEVVVQLAQERASRTDLAPDEGNERNSQTGETDRERHGASVPSDVSCVQRESCTECSTREARPLFRAFFAPSVDQMISARPLDAGPLAFLQVAPLPA